MRTRHSPGLRAGRTGRCAVVLGYLWLAALPGCAEGGHGVEGSDSGPSVEGGMEDGRVGPGEAGVEGGGPDASVGDAGEPDTGAPVDCVVNGDCDDGVACTTDSCGMDGVCMYVPEDADGDMVPREGCLGGADCDDSDPNVHPGVAEACDGQDNDCSGTADDGPGMECMMGSGTATCTTSCGEMGTRDCTDTCTFTSCLAAEVCNGCDDDGDGESDNGFFCAAGDTTSCVTGCDLDGQRTCLSDCSDFGACVADEACNGCDDDLDGQCDNGFGCCLGQSEACTVSGCSGVTTCMTGCVPSACDLGSPPGNDACGSLPVISGSETVSFSTCAAANDVTASCGMGAAAPDVIFRLEVALRSDVVVEVTDAPYDTVLSLRGGGTCPGTEIACDDDGGAGSLSRIATILNPGTYHIVVDGHGSDEQGAGSLAVSITPRTPPTHDDCASALPVRLNAGRTVVAGSTWDATDSGGACGTTASDVWYRFSLVQREVVMIHSFGADFDTVLGMRDGDCAAATTPCADDDCGTSQSRLVRNLPAGDYYVLVDGAAGAAGDFSLTIEHLPVGANDAPTELPSPGQSTWSGVTSGTGLVRGQCRTSLDAPETLYYWTQCPGAGGGSFSGDTCNGSTTLDTVIYLVSGPTGTELVCNDDIPGDPSPCSVHPTGSHIDATVPSGAGLFGYYVDGYASLSGAYRTTITRP